MSQSPLREDPAWDLESTSSEELERVLIALSSVEEPEPEDLTPPPPNRRCDSTHREILRQPFFLDR
jgi:hypothetical protein